MRKIPTSFEVSGLPRPLRRDPPDGADGSRFDQAADALAEIGEAVSGFDTTMRRAERALRVASEMATAQDRIEENARALEQRDTDFAGYEDRFRERMREAERDHPMRLAGDAGEDAAARELVRTEVAELGLTRLAGLRGAARSGRRLKLGTEVRETLGRLARQSAEAANPAAAGRIERIGRGLIAALGEARLVDEAEARALDTRFRRAIARIRARVLVRSDPDFAERVLKDGTLDLDPDEQADLTQQIARRAAALRAARAARERLSLRAAEEVADVARDRMDRALLDALAAGTLDHVTLADVRFARNARIETVDALAGALGLPEPASADDPAVLCAIQGDLWRGRDQRVSILHALGAGSLTARSARMLLERNNAAAAAPHAVSAAADRIRAAVMRPLAEGTEPVPLGVLEARAASAQAAFDAALTDGATPAEAEETARASHAEAPNAHETSPRPAFLAPGADPSDRIALRAAAVRATETVLSGALTGEEWGVELRRIARVTPMPGEAETSRARETRPGIDGLADELARRLRGKPADPDPDDLAAAYVARRAFEETATLGAEAIRDLVAMLDPDAQRALARAAAGADASSSARADVLRRSLINGAAEPSA